MRNRIIGISLIMLALWGGAWVVHTIGAFHWAAIPTIITALFMTAFGFAIGIN